MTNAMQNPTPTREIVATNLRTALKDQRWSERRAADALGLTHAYVNRRVSGETELSGSDIAMFASFLRMREQDFFTQITNGSLARVTELRPRATVTDRAALAPVTDIGA